MKWELLKSGESKSGELGAYELPLKEWRVNYWEAHSNLPSEEAEQEALWEAGVPLSWGRWLSMKDARRRHWSKQA